ncbi:MAG: radical SAM family heme chaperone HemW [Clostridiales bacterium]|nr:radical SAM family heme chaperone HemW [Clostridiales bacterium]
MRRTLLRQQREREQLQRDYARSQRGKSLGIYLHVPFCRSKCAYCDFYSLPHREGDMDRYLAALTAHLRETAPQAAGRRVDTVYIGGGTPTLLGEKRLTALLRTVRRCYSLERDCEITLEANPESVTLPLLRTVRRAGVNRLSLGLQSANDNELRAVGRPHTFAQAQEAVRLARKAGIRNLSLDLIYGLPEQTMDSWQHSVEEALKLNPEHLSCYGLQVEEGTWLYDHIEDYDIADDDLQADMYLWMVERLAAAGYEQYEISNFARPGRASRHNLRYWRLEEYVGFGPGAHSDFGGRRYSFVRDLDRYLSGIEDGSAIVDEDQLIPQEERRSEYIMLGLRTAEGIDGDFYSRRYHMNFKPLERILEGYAARGLAQRQEGDRWRLTPEGFLLSNGIILDLLEAQEHNTVDSLLGR